MQDAKDIVVVGAGIIGITSALELQRRGLQVMLLDPKKPGRETSYGNSGVISDASVVIVNNPALPRNLPKLFWNRNNKLRYSPGFVLKRFPWVLRFLSYCTHRHLIHAAHALRALQVLTLDIHKSLIAEADAEHLFRQTGFLKVFRNEAGFRAFDLERSVLEKTGVHHTVLTADQLAQIEPGLKPIFVAGVLIDNACSISSPAALSDAYLKLFTDAGGEVREGAAIDFTRGPDGEWTVVLANGTSVSAGSILISAGPWSSEIASWLGYNIPMAWERGYHLHLEPGDGPALSRPVHDVDAGYVMSPQLQGIRVTSGSELADRDAPPNYAQINAVVAAAHDAVACGNTIEATPWMGRRPTLVDSLPMIGRAPHHAGIWFNFGHQHTGLGMSTGSARIISNLIFRDRPPIDITAFRPDRFRL